MVCWCSTYTVLFQKSDGGWEACGRKGKTDSQLQNKIIMIKVDVGGGDGDDVGDGDDHGDSSLFLL